MARARRRGRAAADDAPARGEVATFTDLIAPVSPEAFFARSWESRPLHIVRSDSRYFESLLTRHAVETALSSGGLRYPAIQLAKGGGFFPPEAFTRDIRSGGEVFSGVPDVRRIEAEYRAGATISLPAFHRAWGPLAELTAAIEADFDHPVHANVYLTPANSVGFSPHYDTHEVFVLQIAGRKHWQVYAPPLGLPHRSQPFAAHGPTTSPPLLEVELAPGDLLYLPRGFVHTTRTSADSSLHVSLGITVYTWVELLAEWFQTSRRDLRFRRALPPGFAGKEDVRRRLEEELPALISTLAQDTDYGDLLEAFSRRIRSGASRPPEEFRTDLTAGAIKPLDM
jgi:hypothetical protein